MSRQAKSTENTNSRNECRAATKTVMSLTRHSMTGQTENSGGGIATEREARRVLARAMVALGRAQDPRDVLDQHEDDIFAALRVLGGNHPLARALGIAPAS